MKGLPDRPDERPEEVEILQALMDYLTEHPQAMDTLEGIARWWLPQPNVRVAVVRVARAVDLLTSRGILERIDSGENARYRLKRLQL